MTEQPPIPPTTETKTTPPIPETTTKTTAPAENENDSILLELRDEYKNQVSAEQWDAVKNLSIAKQIKLLKVMLPKPTADKPVAKPDINTPLNTPPVTEKRVKTFLERQKEANYSTNLQNAGGLLSKINKLYGDK